MVLIVVGGGGVGVFCGVVVVWWLDVGDVFVVFVCDCV